MTHLHIVTVGISLLTNFARANNLPLEQAVLRVYYLHETYHVPIALPFCAVPF